MNDDTIPKQSGCPTCHCTLWSEQDDFEPAVIRDAERYRWLRRTNALALLGMAWGASRAACEIGGDCDAAIDAAMNGVIKPTTGA